MDASIIQKIRDLGFRVFMINPEDTWLIYTDGTNIGYLQDDRGIGLSISTVHKPNRESGTGFTVAQCLGTVDVDILKTGFVNVPHWDHGRYSQSVKKYKDIEEYLNADSFNKRYREILN